jgi:hypothetical protein
MGDDSIDTVISHIDMGYLVTLAGFRWKGFTSTAMATSPSATGAARRCRPGRRLTVPRVQCSVTWLLSLEEQE